MYTTKDFILNTGDEPHQDDLERANCSKAGMSGHQSCGICIHNKPVFKCQKCFCNCHNKDFKRLTQTAET